MLSSDIMDLNPKNLNFSNLNLKIILPAVITVLVATAIGGYFIYQKTTSPVQQAAQNPQDEVRQLVAEVGKLIELPKGEDPTVATVTDVEQLRTQPFFQNAQNGDKVLIYQNAKKAILYSPSTKKVLEVAPLNIGTESAQPAPTSTATPQPVLSPASPEPTSQP